MSSADKKEIIRKDFFTSISAIQDLVPKDSDAAEQRINDLEKQLSNHSDPGLELHLLILKGDLYFSRSDYSNAIQYLDKALENANSLEDLNSTGLIELKLGRCYHHTADYNKAQDHYDKAARIFEQLDDQLQLARSLNNLGNAFFRMSDFEKAAEYYLKAHKIFEEEENLEGASYSMNNLGNLYERIKQYDNAEKYYSDALKIFREQNDIRSQAIALNNIGNVFSNAGDHHKALEHFYKSAELRKTTGDQTGIAIVYMNIADVLSEIGKLEEALEYVNEAKAIYKKTGQKFWYGMAFITLARLHSRSGNQQIALEGIDTAIDIGTKTNARDLLREASFEKSKICEALGDLEGALSSYKQFTTIKDELFNQERNRVIVEMQKKFEADAKEKEAMIYWLKNVELREKNDELENQSVELRKQKERAERSEKFKEEFLANMSHEIRTPMNAIMGITKLLIKNKPREDQQDYLKAISRSSDNLLVIINDILDLSKIEAGKMELENISFNLKELLLNIKDILSFKSEEKHIDLLVTAEDGLPQFLKGDPTRLNQILINLAGNAIKFTEKGKVDINVKLERTENNRSTIRFSVKDTGIGIPKDRLDAIFESFSQASGDTTRKFGGTGLGLTISQKLVDLMGGTIKVKSEPGKGSCFYFVIEMDHAENSTDHHEGLSDDVRKSLKGSKVLLVEDNEFNIMVAVDTIETEVEGIALEIARNGQEAVDMIKAGDYQLVLMDIQMPVLNGLEATKAIRGLVNKKSLIPIMAMTAHSTKAEVDRCFDAGMDEYITKPFDVNDLISKIHRLIIKQKQ